MKLPSIFRLVAVILLAVILLPPIFSLYCGLRPDAGAEEIGTALLAAVPLGEQIINTILAVTGNKGEGLVSALDWLNTSDISKAEMLYLEISQIFLISVIMLALETLIGIAFKKVESGLINQIANILYKTLVVFTAALFTKWVYIFFIEQVSQLTGTSQQAWIYAVSALSIIGSVAALILSKGFFKSMMKCSLKMIEALLTFILGISLLLGIFPWFIIIIVWIAVIWGIYFVEKLIK